jgi:nitroimidazol reductase NimA-like FMN-containing flavoprotein (pyridoxamine 5'-phosphate oxidase superfamily)
MLTRRIETLTPEQSTELLHTVGVGRVIFTDKGLPAVLPVTFVVDDGAIVIRTAQGSRLAKAADDAVVAFEADELHSRSRTGWSVVVTGHAQLEHDEAEQQRIAAVLEPWVPGIKDAYIRIPMTVVTGRRVTAN